MSFQVEHSIWIWSIGRCSCKSLACTTRADFHAHPHTQSEKCLTWHVPPVQVEHGITEMVSGLDLVNWQLQLQVPGLIPPDLTSKDAYPPSGWAIEVRMNAEDPFKNFGPSSGILGEVSWPPGELRISFM